MKRQQKQQIINDLKKKMVFITGPRQVGKTWLGGFSGIGCSHFHRLKLLMLMNQWIGNFL